MRYFLAVILVFVFVGAVVADVPHLISFQGRLTTATGDTVTGNHDITFKLYDATSAELWSETHNDVPIVAGLYNVMLGSETPFPVAVDFSEQYYLGVTVDGGTEMTPRYQLGASPYALGLIDTLNKPNTDAPSLVIMNLDNSVGDTVGVVEVHSNNWNSANALVAKGLGNDDSNAFSMARLAGCGADIPGGAFGNYGVYGHKYAAGSPGYGVMASYGLDPTSPTTWAYLAGDSYAGYFDGDVHITGDLTVDGSYPGGGGGQWTDGGTYIYANNNNDVMVSDDTQSEGIRVEYYNSPADACGIAVYENYPTYYSLAKLGWFSNDAGLGSAPANCAVYAEIPSSGAGGNAIHAVNNNASGYAGYFEGDVHVTGEITSDVEEIYVIDNNDLQPGDGATNYSKAYGYLTQTSLPSGPFYATLHLPNGAVVDSARTYFWDNNASDNVIIDIHRRDREASAGGAGTLMMSLSSSGTGALVRSVGSSSSFVVDLSTYRYYLYVLFQSDTDLRFYTLVAYWHR